MTAPALSTTGPRVAVVDSFAALLATRFSATCNAVCWRRTLAGDFAEVARRLTGEDAVATIAEATLRELSVSAAGRAAVAAMVADLRLLRAAGHEPALECVREYARDDDAVLPTDVHSFHVDTATVPTDTFLCTYVGAPSEGLDNDAARRRVDDPAVRALLLARHGGADDAAFHAHLRERHYDLHYAPLPEARPFAFGVGNLWRIAVQYPGCAAPACIHRAPAPPAGGPPRLLLIS